MFDSRMDNEGFLRYATARLSDVSVKTEMSKSIRLNLVVQRYKRRKYRRKCMLLSFILRCIYAIIFSYIVIRLPKPDQTVENYTIILLLYFLLYGISAIIENNIFSSFNDKINEDIENLRKMLNT